MSTCFRGINTSNTYLPLILHRDVESIRIIYDENGTIDPAGHALGPRSSSKRTSVRPLILPGSCWGASSSSMRKWADVSIGFYPANDFEVLAEFGGPNNTSRLWWNICPRYAMPCTTANTTLAMTAHSVYSPTGPTRLPECTETTNVSVLNLPICVTWWTCYTLHRFNKPNISLGKMMSWLLPFSVGIDRVCWATSYSHQSNFLRSGGDEHKMILI